MESTLKLSNYSLNYSTLIARGELDVYRFLGLLSRSCSRRSELAPTRICQTPGSETLARVRRAYLDHGLSVAVVTVSTEFGQPPDGLGAELDRVRKAIQAAAFLGAPLLRVFAGSASRRLSICGSGKVWSSVFDRSVRRLPGLVCQSAYKATIMVVFAAPVPICFVLLRKCSTRTSRSCSTAGSMSAARGASGLPARGLGA